MEIVNKKLSELKLYEKNPRKNDNAVDYVAKSIEQFGFKVPIVIDKNNVIIAGHTRYKASEKLGLNEVPCIIADDLTDEQVKAFRLADNKVSEMSEWDYDLLNMELDDIVGIDMEDFGFLDINADDYGTDFDLPDGDKSNLEQITFTLTNEQAKAVREAIKYIQDNDLITETFGNENKNGNALYEVIKQWEKQKK